MMSNQELTNYADKLCLQLFGIKYDSYAKFESTTTACVGRFESVVEKNLWGEILKRTRRYHIEILKPFIKRHPDQLEKTMGHELCHYYCYVTGKPYHDYDGYFQKQLKKHRLPAICNIIDDPKRYVIYCPKCHNMALFKTHIKSNYTCAFDNADMKRYGFVQLRGCYKPSQIMPAIKRIVFRKDKTVDKFNVKLYDRANKSVSKGQQMALFA